MKTPATAQRTHFERLKKLIQANHSLAAIESLGELLDHLMDLAQDTTNSEASSILLYNSSRQVLEFALAKNKIIGEKAQVELLDNVELKLGQGLAGWVAQHGRSLLVKDARHDTRFFRNADAATGFVTRSLLCSPLMHRNELLGVIQVINPCGKDFFDEEDQDILESFASLASVAILRSRLLRERLRQQRLEAQLEAASRIQSHFWPELPNFGEHGGVWAYSRPAVFVGGDLYDCINLGDGSYLLYVADVAGKGLPASLVMAAVWSQIRNAATENADVGKLLAAVNAQLYDFLASDGLFVTIVAARYRPETGDLQLASGGHLPPLLRRGNDFSFVPQLHGLPLGITPDQRYESEMLRLETGDSILFITDGVSEARNSQGDMFEEDRIRLYMQEAETRPYGKGLVREVNTWCAEADPADDLTLLEIYR